MRTIKVNSTKITLTSSKDVINAYGIWSKIPDIPFTLAKQMARFIRINPERSDSPKTNCFSLDYYPDENVWEAVTENIASLDGKRHFLSVKVANFDPRENYQMTL